MRFKGSRVHQPMASCIGTKNFSSIVAHNTLTMCLFHSQESMSTLIYSIMHNFNKLHTTDNCLAYLNNNLANNDNVFSMCSN